MPKYSYLYACFFFLFINSLFGQKKVLQTLFTDEKITIDGKFDELAWEKAAVASDFVMINPDNGKPIPKEKRTEVKIV